MNKYSTDARCLVRVLDRAPVPHF